METVTVYCVYDWRGFVAIFLKKEDADLYADHRSATVEETEIDRTALAKASCGMLD